MSNTRHSYKKKFLQFLLLLTISTCSFAQQNITSYTCDPHKEDVKLYWLGHNGKPLGSLVNLVDELKHHGKNVIMAMNGGMYLKDLSPQGLYIEGGKTCKKTSTATSGYGNFYMQPNGIFYIKKDKTAGVCATQEFSKLKNIAYATQSGPMLVHNGKMNSHFIKGSSNLHIRNGVGILPDGRILFAISDKEINFYDFATFFIERGCKNALYLDGFVSGIFLPSLENKIRGNKPMGVMIAVTTDRP